jgi:hypothetical protein
MDAASELSVEVVAVRLVEVTLVPGADVDQQVGCLWPACIAGGSFITEAVLFAAFQEVFVRATGS